MLETWENGSACGERFATEVAECLAHEHIQEIDQLVTELKDAKTAVLQSLESAPQSLGRLHCRACASVPRVCILRGRGMLRLKRLGITSA